MALVLYRPAFWVSVVLITFLLLWIARQIRLSWAPAWLLRVILVSILLFVVFFPTGDFFKQPIPPQQILIIDQSDSIQSDFQENFQIQAREWQSAQMNRTIIVFGNQPIAVPIPGMEWPQVDGRSSNLLSALEMAAGLFGDSPGNIIIVSDGLVTSESEIGSFIHQLSKKGFQIELVQLPSYEPNKDLYVGPLWVPTSLWEQTPYKIVLPLHIPESTFVTLKMVVNGETVSEETENLPAGDHYITFEHQASSPGILTLEAIASSEGDPNPKNNKAYATVRVFSPPEGLFITSSMEESYFLVETLIQSGVSVDVKQPADLPSDLSELENFQVIFLDNLLVNELNQEQMQALKVFTSRRGGGLVFLGGSNSYTLGGYKNTILEPLLPVRLEPPKRSQRPPITLILAIDRSSSMGLHRLEVKPLALAKESAMRTMETLNSSDYIGVLTYSDAPIWNVEITQVGEGLSLRQALDVVGQIEAVGGTQIYKSLDLLLEAFIPIQFTDLRHVLLLSDGKSSDGSYEKFQELSQSALSNGITISTIALGEEADQTLMSLIAEEANGRYHLVLNPADLPRVMISESRAVRGENIQYGDTSLSAGESNHPILFGLSIAELPTLSAYNALVSKADLGAEDILLSDNFQDPILSAWQFGLGRVIAWMGDAGQEWSNDFTSWPDSGYFWSQILRYALLNPSLGPVQVDVNVEDTQMAVEVQLLDELGVPINFVQPEFSYADETNTVYKFQLSQVGAGVFTTRIDRPPEGAYRAIISYESGEEIVEIPAFFEVNYPKEWQPVDPNVGRQNVKDWVEAGSGEVIDLSANAPLPEKINAKISIENPWWRLMLVAVIYWPCEIAIRRRWLPWK